MYLFLIKKVTIISLQMDKYINQIENFFNSKIQILEKISDTNNLVFKIEANKKVYYLKIYNNNAMHIDNEIMLYTILPDKDKKYFKNLVFSNYMDSDTTKFAVFNEIQGQTLAELLDENKIDEDLANKISVDLIDYFNILSNVKTNKYGILNHSLEGKYDNFLKFLYEYQFPTTTTLFLNKKTRHLSSLPFKLLADNADILNENKTSITPIDSNFKNIIITKDQEVKIIDPGAINSAPIAMGYGELIAHSYGTIIYDKLIKNLGLNKLEIKRLNIYAVFSLLNIIAFLVRNNIGEIEKNKPFGNKYTFFELIDMHLKIINS